jgi:hypothetical protein
VTDLERVGTDDAEPPPHTPPPPPPPQNDAPPERPWWKTPRGAATLAVVLAAIGVGGYFGVNAALPDASSLTTSSSAPGTIDQVPGLPRGAVPCIRLQTDVVVPFNAGARGTPATSCEFVEQVRKAFSDQRQPTSGPAQLSVVSPATSRAYELACLGSGTYVTCTGGSAAVIYLYNRTGSQ